VAVAAVGDEPCPCEARLAVRVPAARGTAAWFWRAAHLEAANVNAQLVLELLLERLHLRAVVVALALKLEQVRLVLHHALGHLEHRLRQLERRQQLAPRTALARLLRPPGGQRVIRAIRWDRPRSGEADEERRDEAAHRCSRRGCARAARLGADRLRGLSLRSARSDLLHPHRSRLDD
jgi:hypothetical protein